MKKQWIITGKGYFEIEVDDPFLKNIKISDLTYTYGEISLIATEDELDKFIYKLIEDESYFKYTGHFEKDSKAHRSFMYGPDEMFHPKNLRI